MKKIIFIFLLNYSLSSISEQTGRLEENREKCAYSKRINILSTKVDKFSWDETVMGKKNQGERVFYVSSLKKTDDNVEKLYLLNDPIINGEINFYGTHRWHRGGLIHREFLEFWSSRGFNQGVFLSTKINCEESISEKIRLRNNLKTQQDKNLKKEEMLLFEENGFSYYFYPPNLISKFKNIKGNEKKLEQTIYLFSLVIDNDLKLRYPSQKDMVEKFELFKKNALIKALEIESDYLITDHCEKC